MKVRALRTFFDKSENVSRRVGEVFEVTAERYKQVKSALPEWIEAVDAEPTDAKTKKATTKRK